MVRDGDGQSICCHAAHGRRSPRSAGEYCAAFSSRCDSATDVRRGSISTSRSASASTRSVASLQRVPARVRRRHRPHRPRPPTGGRRGSPPRRCAPCRGCPGTAASGDRARPMAAPACRARVIGRQIAAQVFNGHPDRGQRRPQVVAQRCEQRRRKIGLLSGKLRRIPLGQKLRPLDRDRHDAGNGVERADVERRRRRASRPTARCRAAAERSTRRSSRRRGCGRRRHADGRRTPACLVAFARRVFSIGDVDGDFLAAPPCRIRQP